MVAIRGATYLIRRVIVTITSLRKLNDMTSQHWDTLTKEVLITKQGSISNFAAC